MTVAYGAILTGGRSSRMGRPKHALQLSSGETILQRTAMTLHVVCESVVTAGSERIADDLKHVDDERPQAGPLAGIETVLKHAPDVDWVVCPCDMPHLESDDLQKLIDAPGAVVAFRLDGRDQVEHFPLLLRSDAFPLVSTLLDVGQRSVGRLLEQAEERNLLYVVELPASSTDVFRNVNTPGDYQAILQQS